MAEPSVVSPILVGRDDLLALADRRLTATYAGDGHMLFLAGEAGIGKSRLLDSIARRATLRGYDVVRSALFPRDGELTGGLLLDLADSLRRSTISGRRETGELLSTRLAPDEDGRGDAHRRRRLLVLDLVELVASLATAGPTMLAAEDLHWADDLSLEVLAQLARRLPRGLLVVATYRSDELYPRVPMRGWRARLITQRLAEEARLPRLTLDETAAVLRAVGGPDAALSKEDIFARSDGIPLHIEEFLAAGEAGFTTQVPDTLADAVLIRAEALPDQARDCALAGAVIGRSFDFELLVDVVDAPADGVAESLRQLRERYFIQPGGKPDTYDFRHALIRDALYDELPLPARRELHARVVRSGRAQALGPAFLSVHCEAAGLRSEAYDHAIAAADEAARLSSHREAFELYRRAQRCQPADAWPHSHAELLVALATEAAAVDDNAAAVEAYEHAYQLLVEAGDPVGAAAVVAPLVAARHLLGDGLALRASRLQQGLQLLDAAENPGESGTGSGATVQARLELLAGLSAANMLDRRLDEAIRYGEAAVALAAQAGNEVTEINATVTLGSALVFAGRMDDGWRLLDGAVVRAVRGRHEAEAARAYRMIGSSGSVLVEYERSRQWLQEGIEYAERVELWNHRHYMAAHLAHVHWATGEWLLARELADAALADGRGGLTTRITALHVLGYLALGQGEWSRARRHLEESREYGERMAELQRLSPALWGLAELALLTGDALAAAALCERGLADSVAVTDAAYAFPFVVTGTRARLQSADPLAAAEWVRRCEQLLAVRSIPGTRAAVEHARGLVDLARGRVTAAQAALTRAEAGWREHSRFWEGQFCRLDLARCAMRTRRAADAQALVAGVRAAASAVAATPILGAADSILPSASPPEAWRPLTAREFEVATLIAAGLTNREAAARLVVSPKTVSAHVEHILTKLGATRRAEIAAWVATIRRPE